VARSSRGAPRRRTLVEKSASISYSLHPGRVARIARSCAAAEIAAARRITASFAVVLEQTHVVERGAHIADFGGRGDARACLCPDLIQPSHDARVPARVGPGA